MSQMDQIINRIVAQPLGGRSGGARAGSGPAASSKGAQKIHTNGHRVFGGKAAPARTQGYATAPKDKGAGIAGGKDDSRDPVPMGKTKRRGGIHIKAKNKGKLHAKLGVAKGKKIPKAKIERAENSSSPALRKEATFAENASHWNHAAPASGHDVHVHVHLPDGL